MINQCPHCLTTLKCNFVCIDDAVWWQLLCPSENHRFEIDQYSNAIIFDNAFDRFTCYVPDYLTGSNVSHSNFIRMRFGTFKFTIDKIFGSIEELFAFFYYQKKIAEESGIFA